MTLGVEQEFWLAVAQSGVRPSVIDIFTVLVDGSTKPSF